MTRAARLRRTSDIAVVRSAGRARSDRFAVIRSRPTDTGSLRLAVTAMRECGTAVRRNRARRRLREAIREALRDQSQAPSLDVLAAARRSVLTAAPAELRQAARTSLEAVLREAVLRP